MIIQSAIALAASLVGGLNQLILFSVFNLAFIYFMTCLSVFALQRRGKMEMGRSRTARIANEFIPFAGMAVCVVIITGIDAPKIIFGAAIILVAVPLYVVAFWHRERQRGVAHPLSQEEVNTQIEHTQQIFLGYLFKVIHRRLRARERRS